MYGQDESFPYSLFVRGESLKLEPQYSVEGSSKEKERLLTSLRNFLDQRGLTTVKAVIREDDVDSDFAEDVIEVLSTCGSLTELDIGPIQKQSTIWKVFSNLISLRHVQLLSYGFDADLSNVQLNKLVTVSLDVFSTGPGFVMDNLATQSIRKLLMAPNLQFAELRLCEPTHNTSHLNPLSFSSSVISLEIAADKGIDAQTAEALAKAKNLTYLCVKIGPTAKNEVLGILATLPQLQTLHVSQDEPLDEPTELTTMPTLASIVNMPSLTSLHLYLRFDDHASGTFQLNPLALTSLGLTFYENRMPFEVFSRLAQSLRQLRQLTLEMPNEHENALAFFESINSISSLTSLTLYDAFDLVLSSIGRLSNLEDLVLDGCTIDYESSKAIASLPSLHSLIVIEYSPDTLSNDSFAALLQSQSLLDLDLSQSTFLETTALNTSLLGLRVASHERSATSSDFKLILRNRRLWYNWCCVALLLSSYRANRGSEIRDSILSLIGEIVESAMLTCASRCWDMEDGQIRTQMEVKHYRTF